MLYWISVFIWIFDTGPNSDKDDSLQREKQVKTLVTEHTANCIDYNDNDLKKKSSWLSSQSGVTVFHFSNLLILGFLIWALLWCAFGENWWWDGDWFRIGAVAVFAWASGQALEGLTGLPPLLAALLTGILARNLNILDMRHFTQIDAFLRKIYPVIILGKASLGWNVSYMKSNWKQVAALGTVPWLMEVITLAVCTKLLLNMPWLWGFLTGSIYASLSCAVVMPPVLRISAGSSCKHNWGQLVCTAGGVDTALSVGVYGLLHTYMFVNAEHAFRYAKAVLTLFVGIILGIIWGTVSGVVPHPQDYYVSELRIIFVLVGGLLGNFFSANMGWGGIGGVAVLACNATAATYWAKKGWHLNKNAASTAYRVIWAACEPMVFAYTGTYFVMNAATSKTLVYGFAILCICLTVRLFTTTLMCWSMNFKQKLFICCTWIPKSIVEAVLSPVAISTLMSIAASKEEMEYAEDLLRLIVQAILITTPLGFLLTTYLGSWLLKDSKNIETGPDIDSRPTENVSQRDSSKL